MLECSLMPISPYIKNLRQYVGKDLLLVPGTAAIVHNQQGDVLLQRRSDNGQWGLLGGAVDPHEAPAQAVVREVFEEAGLMVRPVRCTALIHLNTVYPNGDHLQPTVAVFECEIVAGELKSLDGESLELRFFAPENLPDSPMLTPYPKAVFAKDYSGFYFEWKEEWLKVERV
jgi:8-oxo-dGTP pyrophosphatase MutT (NUDIX family)